RASGLGQASWLSCGSKKAVIVRVLGHRELRLKLARFAANPEELANSSKRESLRDMCREAGIWGSGNKRALSAGLLNWRDRCRTRGQAFLAQMQSLSRDRGFLWLPRQRFSVLWNRQEETAPTPPIWRGIPSSTVARSAIRVAIPVARVVRCFSSMKRPN